MTAPAPLDTDSILSQLLRFVSAGDTLDSLLFKACFHLSVTAGGDPATSFSTDADTAALAVPLDKCATPWSLPAGGWGAKATATASIERAQDDKPTEEAVRESNQHRGEQGALKKGILEGGGHRSG